jgi:hypothetical protein
VLSVLSTSVTNAAMLLHQEKRQAPSKELPIFTIFAIFAIFAINISWVEPASRAANNKGGTF